ncbi:hypothetical protein WJX73_009413 [Symbiochloris irregularis]|uniref:Uncharacterized protein n=1 Tax=Symbiochloris irregularis TaxID=706552 RepID=A0AAW1PS44_9CHLO
MLTDSKDVRLFTAQCLQASTWFLRREKNRSPAIGRFGQLACKEVARLPQASSKSRQGLTLTRTCGSGDSVQRSTATLLLQVK